MCGIAGFSGNGDSHDLERMMAALYNRGPDSSGIWRDAGSNVWLGHQRLSIIDLEDGSQPMVTAKGNLAVVFNGEIYNHLELRKQLEDRGRKFITNHSDTEVLLHGFEEWGEGLPDKLDGMWAFSIYDKDRKEFFLSRDRFGKKPLYYFSSGENFIFSSELKSLLKHSRINQPISSLSLQKYYAYGYVPAPRTLYDGVNKLPAGHNLRIRLGEPQISVRKYWDFVLEPFEKIPDYPELEWCERLRELLHLAVKKRLSADVPLGVFLSGGMDSTSIALFAAKELGGEAISTFSIGFDESSFDESNWSEKAAKFLGTNHYLEKFNIRALLDIIPDIKNNLDEPFADSSILPTALLCKITRKKVKVALGGDGGDELFAGYDPFRALKNAELYSRYIPKPVHIAIRLLAGKLPASYGNMSFDFALKTTLCGLSYPKKIWNPVWMGPLEPDELSELTGKKVNIEEVYSEAIDLWDAYPKANLMDRTLQFFTKLYMQDDILPKIDRASMMNSLEVRSPYLDVDLVDFVRRIPSSYKYRNGTTKYILKKALEPELPHEILYRKKKGFGSPIALWFQDETLKVGNKLLDKTSTHFLKQKVKEHINGSKDWRLFLWSQWLLENVMDQ
jgi:asparagine synthase (glutamine-hydrolysing)